MAFDRITRRQALWGLTASTGLGLTGCAEIGDVMGHDAPGVSFGHGVASGDPRTDAVIIWTRATTPGNETIPLRWQLASDETFADILAHGEVTASAASDHTAKVDVTGLAPGQVYFYRFLAEGAASPVGRTKTLPPKGLEQARFAVISCSNFPFGYFHVYREIAATEGLDAVIHLGDYIYEYGPDGYGGEVGKTLEREHQPPHELVTLADYRTRLAQYRTDPDLQAAHASAPFITIWDDHETANNSWMGGASNHDPDTEGRWIARRDAALRAYFEWMPLRDPEPGRSFHTLNRSYEYGDLVSLHLIETRLTGRSEQLSYKDDMVYDASGKPDVERFRAEVLGDENRSMLGVRQELWLANELHASTAKGIKWQMLGNQILMAKMDAPDFSHVFPPDIMETALKNRYVKRWIDDTKLGLPINTDGWDGYPAARERLYGVAQGAEANLLVLAGDSHCMWGNDLHDDAGRLVGVEFGTSGVTSPSPYQYFGDDPRIPGLSEDTLTSKCPDVVYAEVAHNGFILLTLTKDEARAEYIGVSTVREKDYEVMPLADFTVTARERGKLSGLIRR